MAAKKAVYAGSFDLLTTGHMWVIERGVELFDELLVAVGDNPDKRSKAMFEVPDRIRMLEESTAGMPSVKVAKYTSQYLFEYAREVEALYLLRGIRNHDDFDYELWMRNFNGELAPELLSVCLIPPRQLVEVSSSFVKGLIGYNGWEAVVSQRVPNPVFPWIVRHHEQKAGRSSASA